MRLCLICREYPPVTEYSGGIGTAFAGLAPALAGQGHEVHVITVGRGPTWHDVRDGVHLHVLRRPNPERLWFLEEAGWTVVVDRALTRLGRFDVVFAPEWGGELALHARKARRGPVVTNLTTSLVQAVEVSPGWRRTRRMRVRHRVQTPLERAQTERSQALVASSGAILAWTRELWDVDAIPSVVIGNGVPVERVREAASGPLPAGFPDADGPLVVFSGRLEIRKGVDVLLRAMLSVWESEPHARLVLLGRDGEWERGSMGDHLRSLAGPWSSRVHILGSQPQARVFAALEAADVVALPSLWENYALAAVEALALGCAVIATTGGGYGDFITAGENGLLVTPGDTHDLARALLTLLSDAALRERLGATAHAGGDRFDVDAIAAQHARFFAVVAGS